MKTIQPTHITFYNSLYIHVLTYASNIYTPYVFKLTEKDYEALKTWVDTGGHGTYTLQLEDVSLLFVHNHAHPLRIAEAKFSTMRDTPQLARGIIG